MRGDAQRGQTGPGEEHAAAAVRIRKVFVEKLAPAVSGPAVDGGGAVAGSGDSDLRSRYPKYDDFLAVQDWLDPHRMLGNANTEQVFGP